MKKNKTIYIIACVLVIIAFSLGLLAKNQAAKVNPILPVQDPSEKKTIATETIDILTTNKMIYYMAKDIVKDKQNIDYLFKTEDQIWAYNYDNGSLLNADGRDIYFYVGAGYEPWISYFESGVDKNKVNLVNISRGIKISNFDKPKTYRGTPLKQNPYYWLDLNNFKTALYNVSCVIGDKDPANSDFYKKNFDDCVVKIDKSIKSYKEISPSLKNFTFVVYGEETDYLVKFLGLKTIRINNVYDESALKDKTTSENPLVFLYANEGDTKICQSLITKYKMLPLHILTYDYNLDYYATMDKNLEGLKNIIEKK